MQKNLNSKKIIEFENVSKYFKTNEKENANVDKKKKKNKNKNKK